MSKPKGAPPKGTPVEDEEDLVAMVERQLHLKILELSEKDEEIITLKRNCAALKYENTNVESLIKAVKADADDILKDMERQTADKCNQVAELTSEVTGLNSELEIARASIAELQAERESTRESLSKAESTMEEKAALQKQCEELMKTIEEERAERRKADVKIQQQQKDLMSSKIELEDLKKELKRSSTTVPVSNLQWSIKRSGKRLIASGLDEEADMPKERERNTLMALSSHQFLYFGGTLANGVCTNETYHLDTTTGKWEVLSVKGELPPVRGGHCSAMYERTGLKKKQQYMVVFGGRRNPLLDDCWRLDVGLRQWTQLKCTGPSPPPAEKACCVILGSRLLVLGGDATQGARASLEPATIPSEVFTLDLDTLVWQRFEPGGDADAPLRCNATATPTDDKRSVYLFGGSDEYGNVTNDLHKLNVDRMEWEELSTHMIMGQWPGPREGHAASMVGRFLVVTGGWNEKGRIGDTWVLDTDRLCWSLLDSADPPAIQPSNPRPRAKFQGVSTDGRKVIGLGCGAYGNTLDECEVMDVQVPEEAFASIAFEDVITAQAVQQQSDPRIVDIWWKAPPSTASRIRTYKVLVSVNGSTTVETLYVGTDLRYQFTNARPSTGYDFRVKGEYEDGSVVWSDVSQLSTAISVYSTHYPGASPSKASSRASSRSGHAPVYIHHSPATGGGPAPHTQPVVRGPHMAGRQFTTPSPVMWRG